MSNSPTPSANLFQSRRAMLQATTAGFGYLAFSGLTAEAAQQTPANPLLPKKPHFAPKVKRVIFLCMRGGPSQTDTFDYKPVKARTTTVPLATAPTKGKKKKSSKYGKGPAGSAFKFNQHGESGMWMSEAFNHLGKHADDMCVINSMWTNVPNHPQSFLMLHTGEFRFPRPSMGSWLLYGLGTENQNLPGFITINPPTRVGGAQNYASGFLPPIYQGTSIGHIGMDITQAGIGNVKNEHLPGKAQRKQIDLVQQLNQEHLRRRGTDTNVEGVIQSLELGFRMQDAVPGVMDISTESKATLDMYGIDADGEPLQKAGRSLDDKFGLQCLLARRLSEAGVRFVEICHSNWDQHGAHRAGVKANGLATDQGIAALLTDLKTRGLLDETLVIWASLDEHPSRVEKTAAGITRPGSPCGWRAAELRVASTTA